MLYQSSSEALTCKPKCVLLVLKLQGYFRAQHRCWGIMPHEEVTVTLYRKYLDALGAKGRNNSKSQRTMTIEHMDPVVTNPP